MVPLRVTGIPVVAVTALLAVPVWCAGPAQAFQMQAADDAAHLLARLVVLEDRCGITSRGNRAGLAALVRSGGTWARLDAERRTLERMLAQDGLAAICADLAATPGLGSGAEVVGGHARN